ncbi:MAG: Si-specific NAD(P)(+) transhydrogenase, partial [Pseudonocardia sp.]
VKSEITIGDLLARTRHVVGREVEVVRNQLLRNHVDIVGGTARFVDPHTVVVEGDARGDHNTITAENIVIATGTTPARPAEVQFDDERVLDSDAVLRMQRVPGSLVVVGAGVIGIEYASMFAALGTRVTVVEKRPQMLDFCDPEVVESLKFHLRDQAVTFRFGEEVERVEVTPKGTVTSLASGKRIAADMVMYSAGRQGVTEELQLDKAGLTADRRGRITVDKQYRTEVPHIFAVGDVIGFPALAATSMDQGRLAAYHAFGEPARELQELQPIGIYTVPEISYCGRTEAELTSAAVPYEVGMSRYRELARGAIVGDSYGMLKLLVSTDDRTLLGVHVFGTGATDLVHIGQALMGCGGTVDYLVDTVLNYPTLSEAYKVAALDVTNKIRALEVFDNGSG